MTGRRKWVVGFCAAVLSLMAAAPLLTFFAWRVILGPEQGHYFDSQGTSIYYVDEGAGPPLLLVHGFASSANLEWRTRGLLTALSGDYRVIAPDNRGHGRSDKPHAPEAYGVQMVEDLVRLLDHLGIEKTHVVGYSMGGFIALKLAAMHPERLWSAAPCGAGWEQLTEDNYRFGEDVALALETGTGIGPLGERLGMGGSPPRLHEKAGIKLGMRYFNDPLALAAVMRAFHQLAVSEAELHNNTVPVLTIIGGEDGLLPGAKALAERMADHRLLVLEGKDHFNTPAAENFLRELQNFLKEHTP